MRLVIAETAITAAPVHAAVVYAVSAGNSLPAGVPAERIRPRRLACRGDRQDDRGHRGGEADHAVAEDRHREQHLGEGGTGEREKREGGQHQDRAARQERGRADPGTQCAVDRTVLSPIPMVRAISASGSSR